MADLSKLSDEQLQVYREMLAKKQGETPAPNLTPSAPEGGPIGRAVSTFASDLNPISAISAMAHPINTLKSAFQSAPKPAAMPEPKTALDKVRYFLTGGRQPVDMGEPPVLGDVMHGRIPEALGHMGAIVAAPAITKGIGSMMRSAAGPLAENAIGLTARNRPEGVPLGTVGREVMERTEGVRPETIARTGKEAIGNLSRQVEQAASSSNAPTSLAPARQVVGNAIGRATQYTDPTAGALEPMQRFLHEPGGNFPGAVSPQGEIEPIQSPETMLETRRRFNEAFGGNRLWKAQAPREVQNVAKRTYGELTGELHRAVPETVEPDQSMRLLIPGVRSAERTAAGPGVGGRVLTRLARPTGALVGAGLGYAVHGAPGAALGLVVPEVLSSPAVQMGGARMLNSGGNILRNPSVAGASRVIPLVNLSERQQ